MPRRQSRGQGARNCIWPLKPPRLLGVHKSSGKSTRREIAAGGSCRERPRTGGGATPRRRNAGQQPPTAGSGRACSERVAHGPVNPNMIWRAPDRGPLRRSRQPRPSEGRQRGEAGGRVRPCPGPDGGQHGGLAPLPRPRPALPPADGQRRPARRRDRRQFLPIAPEHRNLFRRADIVHERLPLVSPACLLVDACVLFSMRDDPPRRRCLSTRLVLFHVFGRHCL